MPETALVVEEETPIGDIVELVALLLEPSVDMVGDVTLCTSPSAELAFVGQVSKWQSLPTRET